MSCEAIAKIAKSAKIAEIENQTLPLMNTDGTDLHGSRTKAHHGEDRIIAIGTSGHRKTRSSEIRGDE